MAAADRQARTFVAILMSGTDTTDGTEAVLDLYAYAGTAFGKQPLAEFLAAARATGTAAAREASATGLDALRGIAGGDPAALDSLWPPHRRFYPEADLARELGLGPGDPAMPCLADAYRRAFGTALLQHANGGRPAPAAQAADRPAGTPGSSWHIVRCFRDQASPLAFDLAGYLAAAPLTLPVMRAVQQALLPASRPAHLAELFLYGLLVRAAQPEPGEHPDRVLYGFPPGVRDDLLCTRREAYSVLEELSLASDRLAPRFGASLDYRVLAHGTAAIAEGGRSSAFAQVAVTVLGGLGGSREAIARQIAARLEPPVPGAGEPGTETTPAHEPEA